MSGASPARDPQLPYHIIAKLVKYMCEEHINRKWVLETRPPEITDFVYWWSMASTLRLTDTAEHVNMIKIIAIRLS